MEQEATSVADHSAGEDDRPVVAYEDGSYESREATARAARLARACGAPLVALRAWQPWLGELRPSARAASCRRLAEELRGGWALTAGDSGEAVQLEVAEGEPEAVLLERAAYGGARAVVVGSSRATHALAHRLVAAAESPVALIPVAGAARPLRRLVLGVDDSGGARAATRWLAQLLAGTTAEVVAATVFEPLVEWVPADHPTSQWHRLREQLTGPWTRPLRSEGVAVDAEVCEGIDPVAGLVRIARQRRADAIVVGQERRHHRHLWHTPLALRVAASADVAVICVPPSW